jgi:transcriptional regulator with XRE-family HTH domain
VPRKHPVSEIDREIGRRLQWIRIDRQFTREELAPRADMSAGTIARVELGRMPLRYVDGKSLLRGLAPGIGAWPDMQPINPLWLAEGMEPVIVDWPLILPAVHHLRIEFSASFSSVVAAYRDLLLLLVKSPSAARLPEAWLPDYLRHWDRLDSKAAVLWEDAELVEGLFKASADKLAGESALVSGLLADYEAFKSEPKSRRPWETNSRVLTDITESRNVAAMRSPLAQLIGRVRKITAQKGMKASLAKFLDVPAPRVSEWLREKNPVEPGGETTLRLLKWVEQQEPQQK